jgi:hypothetical protein
MSFEVSTISESDLSRPYASAFHRRGHRRVGGAEIDATATRLGVSG